MRATAAGACAAARAPRRVPPARVRSRRSLRASAEMPTRIRRPASIDLPGQRRGRPRAHARRRASMARVLPGTSRAITRRRYRPSGAVTQRLPARGGQLIASERARLLRRTVRTRRAPCSTCSRRPASCSLPRTTTVTRSPWLSQSGEITRRETFVPRMPHRGIEHERIEQLDVPPRQIDLQPIGAVRRHCAARAAAVPDDDALPARGAADGRDRAPRRRPARRSRQSPDPRCARGSAPARSRRHGAVQRGEKSALSWRSSSPRP